MKMQIVPLAEKEISNEVLHIIREYLGAEYRVFLFGSRAIGTARAHSDYDFGVEGPAPIDWSILGEIQEAVEDIPTLYKIDVVDFAAVSPSFKRVAKMRIKEIED